MPAKFAARLPAPHPVDAAAAQLRARDPFEGEDADLSKASPERWAAEWSWKAARLDFAIHKREASALPEEALAELSGEESDLSDWIDTTWVERPWVAETWPQVLPYLSPLGLGRVLACAAYFQELRGAELLRDFHALGVDLSTPISSSGATALMQAVCPHGERDWTLVSFLSKAANPLAVTTDGESALTFLVGPELNISESLARLDCLPGLLPAQGVHPGRSALFDAVELVGFDRPGHRRLIELLLPACDLFETNAKDLTALDTAMSHIWDHSSELLAREMMARDPVRAKAVASATTIRLMGDRAESPSQQITHKTREWFARFDQLCVLGALTPEAQDALLRLSESWAPTQEWTPITRASRDRRVILAAASGASSASDSLEFDLAPLAPPKASGSRRL
jgi:hypothetical protein